MHIIFYSVLSKIGIKDEAQGGQSISREVITDPITKETCQKLSINCTSVQMNIVTLRCDKCH